MRDYTAIPYLEHGRTIEGLDCYGLVCLYYKDNFNVDLMDFDYQPTVEDMARIVEGNYAEEWAEVNTPRKHDMLLLRQLKEVSHVGVMIDDHRFMHCEEGIGVTVVNVSDCKWKRRIAKVMRYKHHGTVATIPTVMALPKIATTIAGVSIAQIVSDNLPVEMHKNTIVTVCGQQVPPEYWETSRIKEGAVVHLAVVPKGGAKDILRVVLSIAVVAFTAGIGGGAFGGLVGYSSTSIAIARGVASLVGMLLVNALVPPSQIQYDDLNQSKIPQAYSITGASNQLKQFGYVPVIIGKMRYVPPFGIKPYTLIKGDDQYLHCCFVVEGDYTVTEPKIGDTLLTEFEDYDYLVTTSATPPVWYYKGVDEQQLSVDLTQAAGPQVRTTAADTEAANIDIYFAQGLVKYDDEGNPTNKSVLCEIKYRSTGVGSYVNAVGYHVSGVTVTNQGAGYDGGWHTLDYVWSTSYLGQELPEVRAFVLPGLGRVIYIEIISNGNGLDHTPTFTMPASAGTPTTDAVFTTQTTDGWLFKEANPQLVRRGIDLYIPTSGQYDIQCERITADNTSTRVKDLMTWTALRSKDATAPINVAYTLTKIYLRIKANGQLNGVINNFSAIFDDGNSNPEDGYIAALTGDYTPVPVTTGDINTTQLALWGTFCDTNGLEFNCVIDNSMLIADFMQSICSAGMAAYSRPDNLHSVIIDEAQTTVRQTFAAANVNSFAMSGSLMELPHALRVQFTDKDNGYTQGEEIVYQGSYTSSTATKFEVLSLFGVTDSDQAWKLAKRYLAVGEYQKENFTIGVDLEWLACNRGDLIRYSHHVPQIGQGSGRITSIGPDYVELDETMDLDGAETYVMVFRKEDNTSVNVTLTASQDGETRQYYMVVPAGIKRGDMASLYLSGSVDTGLGLVIEIATSTDLKAALTCVPYSDNVYSSFTGAIPAYTPPGVIAKQLNPPRSLASLEYLYLENGSVMQGVTLTWLHSDNTLPDYYEVQVLMPNSSVYEAVGTTQEARISLADTSAGTYSFRVRAVAVVGLSSAWVYLSDTLLSVTDTPPPDVTGLQASYRNSKLELTWNTVTDLRGVEYVVRFGNSFDGGSTVSIQSFTNYTPSQDGGFYVKARAVVGGAYSTNAAVINVTGVNQATNVVQTVTEDWSGTLEGSCYQPVDYLARRWFGTDGLPSSSVWLLSSRYAMDTGRLKLAAGTGAADIYTTYNVNGYGEYRSFFITFEQALNATTSTTERIRFFLCGPDDTADDSMALICDSRNSQYEFQGSKISAFNVANSGAIRLEMRLNIAARTQEIYIDGVLKASGNADVDYTSLDTCLYIDGPASNALDIWIDEIQVGNRNLSTQAYINAWSGIAEKGNNNVFAVPATVNTTGYYTTHTDNQLDLGHDDWIIASVPTLTYHGSDSRTNLLIEDDLLTMDDLFDGATNKLIVRPQIRVKLDGGAWGDWVPFVNASYYGRYFDTRLEVICQEFITAYITAFVYSYDMSDRLDQGKAVAILAAGTNIVYTTPFQAVQHPQVTQVGAVAGDTVILTNESNTGFTIQVLDSSGSGKDAVISYLVRGY